MSKTYIPKIGPKKAVAPPERRKVNYDPSLHHVGGEISVSYLPLRLNVPFLMYLQPLRSFPYSHQTYR